MGSANTRTTAAPAGREQLSTRIVFFVTGAGMAAWAPLVPFAKARTGIDEGVLGLLLLCLGIGFPQAAFGLYQGLFRCIEPPLKSEPITIAALIGRLRFEPALS